MSILSWLVSAILLPFFRSITDFLEAQQTRADEVRLGQKTQAVVDEQQQVVAATAVEKETADVVQAENASLVKSIANPSSLRDPDPDSRD